MAYNIVQRSNIASGENVYDTPDTPRKPIVNTSKKSSCQVLLFDIVAVLALFLAVVAVLLFFVQLSNNASQQQKILMYKTYAKELLQHQQETLNMTVSLRGNVFEKLNDLLYLNASIGTLRFELSSLRDNVSEQLDKLFNLIRLSTCGGPGWRRVAFIDMTDPNQDCPQGLNLTGYPIRSCGRAHSEGYNCSSVIFQ